MDSAPPETVWLFWTQQHSKEQVKNSTAAFYGQERAYPEAMQPVQMCLWDYTILSFTVLPLTENNKISLLEKAFSY